MRYRIETQNYFVEFDGNREHIKFHIAKLPGDFCDSLDLATGESYLLNEASKRRVTEAIRLIANETRGNIICSTGQKDIVTRVWKNLELPNTLCIDISIAALITAADGDADDMAAIKAMTVVDMYTIEMDFGESSYDMAGGGGITIMTDAEYQPALSDLENMLDDINVTDEN